MQLETERAGDVLAPVLAARKAEVIDEISQQFQISTAGRWASLRMRVKNERNRMAA